MSKTKRKQQLRRDRRPVRRQPWYERLPLLPIVVGGILVAAGIAVVVFNGLSASASPNGPVGQIKCEAIEQVQTHYHAHLAIYIDGQPVTVPANIGIKSDPTPGCLYWMHTHDESGIIHIEAPKAYANHQFTLGEFFDVWHQPLSTTQVATLPVGADKKLTVLLDGQPYTGDPRKLVLKAHTLVTLEITPPEVTPPPFTFPSGV